MKVIKALSPSFTHSFNTRELSESLSVLVLKQGMVSRNLLVSQGEAQHLNKGINMPQGRCQRSVSSTAGSQNYLVRVRGNVSRKGSCLALVEVVYVVYGGGRDIVSTGKSKIWRW